MYTAFYGLREKPFALVPDPRYLFLAEGHREALAHLLYGIEEGEGFIAVTGEVGTGKTTICRTLLDRLGSETEVAFLFNPSRSGVELLQDISAEFGLDASSGSRSGLGANLNRFLLAKRREQRRVLLIIDEAQNLSQSTLEQVRLLSNLETSSSKLIQILLLGQPELDRKLDSPQLRQLRQRISVRWALRPLSSRETAAYVRHRLHVAAGARRDLFSRAALREIHRRTGGVPRLINVLCDRTLLAGYGARASRIGSALVKRAAREIPDAKRRPIFQLLRGGRSRAGFAGVVLGGAALLAASLLAGMVFGGTDLARRGLAPFHALIGSSAGRTEVSREPATPRAVAPEPVRSIERTAAASGAPARPALLADGGARAPAPEAVPDLAPPDPSEAPEPVAQAAEPAVEDPEPVGLAPILTFSALLQSQDPGEARRASVSSILSSFGLTPISEVPADDASALEHLRSQGLGVLELPRADLDSLRALNHPALLAVGRAGTRRLLALRRLDGGLASLSGLGDDSGTIRVSEAELVEEWSAQAWVVWNDFERIRRLLAYGERGSAVAWLQSALGELGYYEGDPSGLFDRDTREGLRELQSRRRLNPDGLAGPRTQMVLYDMLERYEVPRLNGARRGGAG